MLKAIRRISIATIIDFYLNILCASAHKVRTGRIRMIRAKRVRLMRGFGTKAVRWAMKSRGGLCPGSKLAACCCTAALKLLSAPAHRPTPAVNISLSRRFHARVDSQGTSPLQTHLPREIIMKTSVAANGGKFRHTLERGARKATAAAHDAIDSAADAAHPALDDVVAHAHEAVDRAGVAAGTLGIKGDQLNDNGKRVVERADGYLRDHLVASLGMAVAAGYVLSRLFSSR